MSLNEILLDYGSERVTVIYQFEQIAACYSIFSTGVWMK